MRVTLIHNPGAGDDEQPGRDRLLGLIRGAGHDALYRSAKEDEWKTALEDPGDLVAVAGGDGTVGLVARHVIGRHIPLAVLPMGTANNISKTLGLTDTPVEDLIAGWATGRRLRFDAGVARGPWGSTHFIEGLGVGLFARAMSWLDATDNQHLAHVNEADAKVRLVQQKLTEWLHSYRAKQRNIRLDGQDLSGEYLLLEAMNIQYIGPNLYLAPEADPGDGLLDVVLVPDGERDELLAYLCNAVAGKSGAPSLTVHRGSHLQMEWEGSPIHLDDETWPPSDWPSGSASASLRGVVEVQVDPQALEFLLPGWPVR